MKRIKKKSAIWMLMAVLLVGLTATGCGTKSTDTSSGDAQVQFVDGKLTKSVTLTVLKGGAVDVTIAEEEGFFKEVGINVKFIGQLEGGTLAQAVAKGDIDLFSSGHIIDIAMARAAGINLKVVLEGMVDSPDADKGHMFFFVRDDGKINSAQDLAGKKIAIASRGSCAEILTDQYLKDNGVDKSKVEFVVMKDTQQEQALRQGQVDVAVLHQPYSYVARQTSGLKVLVSSYAIGEKAGDATAGGLAVRAFSEDFIKKNPAVVEAFVAADVKAQQWVKENFAASKAVYAAFNGTPVSGGNQMPDEQWVDQKKVQFWIDMCVNNGFLQKDAVKATDLFTNEYNPYYNKKLTLTTPVALPADAKPLPDSSKSTTTKQ